MDILEAVAVAMPCASCSGHYEITLKQALLSHQMLHEGCPVSDERDARRFTSLTLRMNSSPATFRICGADWKIAPEKQAEN